MSEARIDRLSLQFDRLIGLVGFNTLLLMAALGLLTKHTFDHPRPHPEEVASAAVSKDAPVRAGASFETKPAASPQDEGWCFWPGSGVIAEIGCMDR